MLGLWWGMGGTELGRNSSGPQAAYILGRVTKRKRKVANIGENVKDPFFLLGEVRNQKRRPE